MLVLTRKPGEKLMIGDEIEVVVLKTDGSNRIQLGIKAPKHIKIHTHLTSTPAIPIDQDLEEFEFRQLKSTPSAT